uniref:ISY1 splicing factor homolog n=1 Tax=Felis catus TaxID=9685 RepID=A0ABI7WVQ9_FELCA
LTQENLHLLSRERNQPSGAESKTRQSHYAGAICQRPQSSYARVSATPERLGKAVLQERFCVSSSSSSRVPFSLPAPNFRSIPFVLPTEKSVVRSARVFQFPPGSASPESVKLPGLGPRGPRAAPSLPPWTALARFRQAQLEEGKVKERRPFLASECTELPKAEKWRRQIIGEISKKVAQIQNAGLGEFRIRDLNDEINKLLREKGHWEVRIKELGGPDYGKVGPKMLDHEGKEVPGNRGYKYFGAAKDLPGVRELFEKEPLPPPRKTRAELMKAIDFEYYGYLDEDDGVIVPLEQEYEKKFRAGLVEKWKAEREARLARGEKEEEEEEEEEINIYAVTEEESDEEGSQEKGGEDGQQKFIAHVPVPSQQEIEEALVRRKKMELLQKYASETLQAQSEEAKRLLGY